MPFGLKNARVTYQRLVNHMFRPQIGRNIEAYGDDMFVTNETLYNRGFSQPYLRCLTPDESHYILRDVHEGACGNHSGARSLVHKIVHIRYYWPSMQADAKSYVKVCDKCQCYNNIPRWPFKYLTLCPFAQWELDILGPFPMGMRQMKFLVVRIDYFTKWVEAEPLEKITKRNVRNLV